MTRRRTPSPRQPTDCQAIGCFQTRQRRRAAVRGHVARTVHFDLLSKLLADDRRSTPADEWLGELADPQAPFRVDTEQHPLLNRQAPNFRLTDHRGQPWLLDKQLARGPVILVFYLGYYCNACIHHLCELNADLERFHRLGAEVVAISDDRPEATLAQFARYGAFGFPVLSDNRHAVAQRFGTFRTATAAGEEELLHGTFVIGPDGVVRWAHCGDAPFRSNRTLLYELARMQGKIGQPSSALTAAAAEPVAP